MLDPRTCSCVDEADCTDHAISLCVDNAPMSMVKYNYDTQDGMDNDAHECCCGLPMRALPDGSYPERNCALAVKCLPTLDNLLLDRNGNGQARDDDIIGDSFPLPYPDPAPALPPGDCVYVCPGTGEDVSIRWKTGCFAPDVMITMSDGSMRRADQIRPGDLLFSPHLKGAIAVRSVVAGPEALPMYRIATSHETIEVTTWHPLFTPAGLVAAKDLKPGDQLLTASGDAEEIITIERPVLPESKNVWNFEVDVDSPDPRAHTLIANGVVSGDLALQRELQGESGKESGAGGLRDER